MAELLDGSLQRLLGDALREAAVPLLDHQPLVPLHGVLVEHQAHLRATGGAPRNRSRGGRVRRGPERPRPGGTRRDAETARGGRAGGTRPPKGDPKRGIRPRNQSKVTSRSPLKSLKYLGFGSPFSDPPLQGGFREISTAGEPNSRAVEQIERLTGPRGRLRKPSKLRGWDPSSRLSPWMYCLLVVLCICVMCVYLLYVLF